MRHSTKCALGSHPKTRFLRAPVHFTTAFLLRLASTASIGVELFFKRLFKKMGIELTDNVAYYLHTKEKIRVRRLDMIKTRSAKQKKNKRKYDKLQEATRQAKKEFLKREGAYQKGMTWMIRMLTH